MHQKILVPLDGSKVGESALPFVEDLISKLSSEVKAEVVLFQALSRVYPTVVGGEAVADVLYTPGQLEDAKRRAIAYLDAAGEVLSQRGVTVTTMVSVGNAAEEIVKCAEETNADLIAMSTHGRSGLSRWAFGSVTDRVLRRRAKVPIVLVKAAS